VPAMPGVPLDHLNEDVADGHLLTRWGEDHGVQVDLPVEPLVGGCNAGEGGVPSLPTVRAEGADLASR
jgi:hypothetical protein